MKEWAGAFRTFLNESRIYSPAEIGDVLERVRPSLRTIGTNKKIKYYDIPCAFDIETTSFSVGEEKGGVMYEWTFGIAGLIIIGRTWEEFEGIIRYIVAELELNSEKRLLCYCHNLAFEFQFIRTHFAWENVFAIENRVPLYALTDVGIEFRCSLLLSGYSLEKLAENLQTYQIRKLVGDLDYSLLRHSRTPMTDEELAYCVNDVKIVMAYIAESIERCGHITKIPLTKTGYVRNYCRRSCFYTPGVPREKDYKRIRYMEQMRLMTLTVAEYKQLKRAFQGGFTHANAFCWGKEIEDVTSFDFTSSYPCVMVAEKFPIGSSEYIPHISREEFDKSLNLYCCLFDIEIQDIEPKIWYEQYISASRCYYLSSDCVTDNGRIVRASKICTTITEQDFFIIRKFYNWSKFRVSNFRRYKRGYLPTDFVKAILKLYQDKTVLKGVEGKEAEYLNVKEMLNSCFGCCVTDIIRELILYQNDHWLEEDEKPAIDYEKEIAKYNENRSRFLFYPWGVWVTAYARRNLFSGIVEFGSDYVYSDTDSIKGRNAEKHIEYIQRYNEMIRKRLLAAVQYHHLPPESIEPKTKDGVVKTLGVWDFDGHYSRFKTLGAKRYLVQYSEDSRNKKSERGKIVLTVAGLNKQECVPYLCRGWANRIADRKEINNPFDNFNSQMVIPKEYTGKNIHYYIDVPRRGKMRDYTGLVAEWEEKSAICLDEAEYSLKISKEYSDYLNSIMYDEW